MRFTTTIQAGGKDVTGIPVPDEVVEALGAGRRPPVVVTVCSPTDRTTVANYLKKRRVLDCIAIAVAAPNVVWKKRRSICRALTISSPKCKARCVRSRANDVARKNTRS